MGYSLYCIDLKTADSLKGLPPPSTGTSELWKLERAKEGRALFLLTQPYGGYSEEANYIYSTYYTTISEFEQGLNELSKIQTDLQEMGAVSYSPNDVNALARKLFQYIDTAYPTGVHRDLLIRRANLEGKEHDFIIANRSFRKIGIVENILKKCEPTIEKGLKEKLSEEEISEVLATSLFEASIVLGQRLIEVRDYETIESKGTFKYSGKANTIFGEGLMPDDVYKGLKSIPELKEDTRHIGPSYLRVKGLLTYKKLRELFATQMAFVIRDYLKENSLQKDGDIVFLPNMTGGAWIGDETRRQAEKILSGYRICPTTPYARATRKPIDVISEKLKFTDSVEGLMPSPVNTAMVINFEELRTTVETTQNAIKMLRHFGYNEENKVRLSAACVFDYRHPVGVERLRRLGVDGIYLVDGKTFFNVSREMGYITNSQHQTAIDWLSDPWGFTRKVLPYVKRLAGK
ncbi:MAG: hypothetical protein ACE5J3_02270 [Methanosarcinales archaeon]